MLERIDLISEDHGVLYPSGGSSSLDYNALCASLSNRYTMPCVRGTCTRTKKTSFGTKMLRSIHCGFVESTARSNGRTALTCPKAGPMPCAPSPRSAWPT
jgi:hypothetical protein